MIRNTFSLLDGIGQRLERRLWGEGILTWSDFINTDNLQFINPQRKRLMDDVLFYAHNELLSGNARYFAGNLRKNEHWRLFDVFKEDAVCLDIETNGLPYGRGGYVTLVGMYDGEDYKCFIRGENLTAEALSEELSIYKYLITFYGSVFDIPFLYNSIQGLRFDIPHFDLCFGARRVGLKGGLKKLETYLEIQRDEEVRGMNGYDAVLLWESAKRGNSRALDLLMLYNKEDTVNLFSIADIIYKRLKASTGIEEYLDPVTT
jgi:uncharacterized protein YprB with RNaseH-like and TPR domain